MSDSKTKKVLVVTQGGFSTAKPKTTEPTKPVSQPQPQPEKIEPEKPLPESKKPFTPRDGGFVAPYGQPRSLKEKNPDHSKNDEHKANKGCLVFFLALACLGTGIAVGHSMRSKHECPQVPPEKEVITKTKFVPYPELVPVAINVFLAQSEQPVEKTTEPVKQPESQPSAVEKPVSNPLSFVDDVPLLYEGKVYRKIGESFIPMAQPTVHMRD